MPGCPYFLANTFGHLLAGLTLTGISTKQDVLRLETNPIGQFGVSIVTLLLIVVLTFIDPGPLKYVLFVVFSLLFGQILSSFVKQLAQQNVLSDTLMLTASVFLMMAFIGFFDKGNMLSWKMYLYSGLFGLILATFGIFFLANTEQEANILKKWISVGAVILFTLFVGYDVQVLQEHAKQCASNPDYVQESIDLYLDVINIFQGIGNLENLEN